MAVARRVKTGVRARPATATAVLSAVGYALVAGTFAGVLPIFPELSTATTNLLSHLIAAINTVALASLLAGVYFIRRGAVAKHRAAMLAAFALILLFLGVYLLKVGGGFEKAILAEGAVRTVYLAMLAVHILLSVVSVPVVLHAVVLGLTHTPAELEATPHARVGRVAATAWAVSLALGIVTYLMLNHVYGWEVREALFLLVAVPLLPPESRD